MIFSQERVNKLNVLCGKSEKNIYTTGKVQKNAQNSYLFSKCVFSQNLTSELEIVAEINVTIVLTVLALIYFPFSMTIHSPMLQQHKGIGFRMCCRQATVKKGITPACLLFDL